MPSKWPNERFTEWRPRDAVWQFGSRGGAAIGELNVRSMALLGIHIVQTLTGCIGCALIFCGGGILGLASAASCSA